MNVEELLLEVELARRRRDRLGWEALANDSRVATSDLFEAAVDVCRRRANDADDEVDAWSALVILHMRESNDVLDIALAALDADDARRRETGADMLREWGGRSDPGVADRIVTQLEQRLELERDDGTFERVVSALAWQDHPRLCGILFALREHASSFVRYSGAAHLASACPSGKPLPRDVVTALVGLLDDDCADIRHSIASDIASDPLVFAEHADALRPALMQRAEQDDDKQVADTARLALRAIAERRATL